MSRSLLVCIVVCFSMITASTAGAQQGSNPYQGTSNPPPNDTIISNVPQDIPAPQSATQTAKPSPDHSADAQPGQAASAPAQEQTQPQGQATQLPANSALSSSADGTDEGIVQVAAGDQSQPALTQPVRDPDGDIVHPAPLGPNELGEGAIIRVRLLNSVSTAFNEEGDTFRSSVASDVVQDGKVLIPAGSEIDGKVTQVSTGTFAGHGSMHLSPESVILPDGSRFRLYAQVTAAPGSKTDVGSEGAISPGSRLKKDGIEYGGAVGAGAITGAVLGGPVGALAGTLIGAGVITTHILVSHPQATLDQGAVLDFMLTEPLNLVPAGTSGN